MMNGSFASENAADSETAALKRVIEQLRSNLYYLEEQAARYGPLDTPLHLKNAIDETTELLSQRETRLRELQQGEDKGRWSTAELRKFWEPFVVEGAKFFVSYDAPDDEYKTRMKVSALTTQAVFNMHRLLVELFADTYDIRRIRLELGGVLKRDTRLERLAVSTHPHLIVLGAPGSQPLSNYVMAQFKGISPFDSTVRQGYIYRVSGLYQGSPFLVSEAGLERYSSEEQLAMQKLGIYDLKPDHPPRLFPRSFRQYDVPSYDDEDCAVIMTGRTSLPGESLHRRVVVIAGHSRHSTLFGTAFTVTNEEWTRQVNALGDNNTETIVGLRPDPTGVPAAPSILDGPRRIYKQS